MNMNNYNDIFNSAPDEGQNMQFSKEEYTAKKQAEREMLYELSDGVAIDIAGDGGQFRQYLDVQTQFDRYSVVNALLILAQKPEATRLGDFDHWKEKGGYVKKDETGIFILEPKEYTKNDGTPGIGYNSKKVFDISQVDTRKIKITPPANFTDCQILAALISKAPVKISGVEELPDGKGAMTDPNTGEIYVLKNMGFDDTFRSVAQELGRCEIGMITEKAPVNLSFAGYCTSYILCKKYGADTRDFSFDAAPTVLGGLEPQEIKQHLSIIRDAGENILSRMAKHLEPLQKAARTQEAR